MQLPNNPKLPVIITEIASNNVILQYLNNQSHDTLYLSERITFNIGYFTHCLLLNEVSRDLYRLPTMDLPKA